MHAEQLAREAREDEVEKARTDKELAEREAVFREQLRLKKQVLGVVIGLFCFVLFCFVLCVLCAGCCRKPWF